MFFAFTDALIIATIACFVRVLNVFAFFKTLGSLFFVITRLFTDVWRWFFIFGLFMFSFQAGIFALTTQAGKSGWELFPTGSMGVGFTAILGEMGNSMEWVTGTFGVVLLLAYSLITQVMLVNLLIAMMGDTYTKVEENSDKEWKFYRYCLIVDYSTHSPCPPPLNLLFVPYSIIKQRNSHTKSLLISLIKKHQPYEPMNNPEVELDLLSDQTLLKMKHATDIVLEEEKIEDRDSLKRVSRDLREHIRILNTQRDNDRIFFEQRLNALEKLLKETLLQVQNSNNGNNSSNPNPPPTPSIPVQAKQ